MRRLSLAAAAVFGSALLGSVLAPAARAHGDPVSEYLPSHQLYVPFDLKASSAAQRRLTDVISTANRQGFEIRVALAWSRYDLGEVSQLWRKPGRFALYVAEDVQAAYKGRVLIVFPSGFGFAQVDRAHAREDAILSTLHVRPGPDGMVDSARIAVRRLAAASGIRLADASAPSGSNNSDRRTIALVALGLLAAYAVLRAALRRR
jgi:hypothetical protein